MRFIVGTLPRKYTWGEISSKVSIGELVVGFGWRDVEER